MSIASTLVERLDADVFLRTRNFEKFDGFAAGTGDGSKTGSGIGAEVDDAGGAGATEGAAPAATTTAGGRRRRGAGRG